jgi:c-di-GMP phosphodiesterase
VNSARAVAGAAHEVLLGRQPIFDETRTVHGFELLFRAPLPQDRACISDGDSATAQVILNALVDIGIQNLTTTELLFINCPRQTLFELPMLPPDRTVLEILEDVAFDNAVLNRIRELRATGYRIALDDFVYDERKSAALAEADYVKLDIRQLSELELRQHIAIVHRSRARIIGEKIESEEEFQLCRKLGIGLFQGYFLRKPDLVRRKSVPTSRLAALQIVSECQNPNVTVQRLASTIAGDAALAWGLLRLANTVLYGGTTPVETLTQAVARLGTEKVMRWAVLLTIAGQQDCPHGYIQLSVQRAYMCEAISRHTKLGEPESVFLVGLLSLLDSIVEVPMSILMRQLPVTPRIRQALVSHEGPAGKILKSVIAWEAGDWDAFDTTGIPQDVAMLAWVWSIARSAEALRSLMEVNKQK